MTEKELKQIRWLHSEIKDLIKRIEDARKSGALGNIIGDSTLDWANDYSTGKAKPITLVGSKTMNTTQIERWRNKIDEYLKQLEKADAFIDSVEDSKVRMLLRLRYVEGLKWEEVAKRVYKNMSSDAARMSVMRYITSQ